MNKVIILTLLTIVGSTSCHSVLTFTPTTTYPRVAKKQIVKIAVVEYSNAKTTDFFNRLRKEMILEAKRAKNIVVFDFLRLPDSVEHKESRQKAFLENKQPDAVLLFTPLDHRTYKWGLLRHSVRKLHLQAEMLDYPTQQPRWGGTFFLDNQWGADVATDKLARVFFQLWLSEGIIGEVF